jgi:hypothetical protein
MLLMLWDLLQTETHGELDYRHVAVGIWLKYHDIARDKVFDEIKDANLRTGEVPSILHIRLPTLDEWVIKQKYGLHTDDPSSFTAKHLDAFQENGVPLIDVESRRIAESVSALSCLTQDGSLESLIDKYLSDFLEDSWPRNYINREVVFEEDYPSRRGHRDGIGGSLWKNETASSLQTLKRGIQKQLLELKWHGQT